MWRPGRAPHAIEAAQRLVDDRRKLAVVAERRDASDREPGRLPHLLGGRRTAVELLDAAVAGAEHHCRLLADHEHERLDDLSDVAAAGGCGFGRGAGRVGKLRDLDRETACRKPFLDLGGGRMHAEE